MASNAMQHADLKSTKALVAIVEAGIMATKNVCMVLGMRAAGGLHQSDVTFSESGGRGVGVSRPSIVP